MTDIEQEAISTSPASQSRQVFRMNNHPSSSRFNGCKTSTLRAHRCRVSAQNINRSIMIRMGSEAAGSTVERRLALAAFAVNSSAIGTLLGRVGGIHFDQVSAAFFEFVSKDGFEGIPALIQDGAVKASFLANHAPRPVNCAFGTRRHVGRLEVFEDHRAEPLRNAQSRFVVPVAADAGSPSRQSSAPLQLLRPAPGAALAARKDALCSTMLAVDGIEASRDRKHLTGRQSEGVCDAAVNADRRTNISRRFMLDRTAKANMPTQGVAGNGDIANVAAHGTRGPELHPADLGYADGGPSCAQSAMRDLRALESKGIMLAFAARARVARFTRKEIRKSFIKIAEGLDLGRALNGADPIKLRAQFRQFEALGWEGNISSGGSSVLPPEVSALLPGQIVDQPADTRKLLKKYFLSGRRREPVFESPHDHVETIPSPMPDINEARTS